MNNIGISSQTSQITFVFALSVYSEELVLDYQGLSRVKSRVSLNKVLCQCKVASVISHN